MSKTTAVALSIFVIALTALIIAGSVLSGTADYIDAVHWVGSPLPPCFADATTCGGHILGTDGVGRDMLARLIVGARTTLVVALFALVCETLIAAALAQLAGRFDVVRRVVARVADAISSIPPWIYLLLLSAISLGKTEPLIGGLSLALWAAILCWPALWRLMIENWSPTPILKKVAHELSMFILAFVTVDFFGFGIQPPLASLGNMLVDMQADMQIAWWAASFPAIATFLIVFAIEIIARIGAPEGGAVRYQSPRS